MAKTSRIINMGLNLTLGLGMSNLALGTSKNSAKLPPLKQPGATLIIQEEEEEEEGEAAEGDESLNSLITLIDAMVTERMKNMGNPNDAEAAIVQAVSNSVFRIEVTTAEPNLLEPYNSSAPSKSSGTGFLVQDDLILTCAHVVEGSSTLNVTRRDSAKKYKADVIKLGSKFDLALIKVRDPKFYEGLTPLQFADVTEANIDTIALGYSAAGEGLQTTRGIISSVEGQAYVHSSATLPLIIMDTPINAGNSGGPLVQPGTGFVVGVNFEGTTDLNSVGHAVPTQVIKKFLFSKQIDGRSTTSFFGVSFQNLENETMREYLGMEERAGILVTHVEKLSPLEAILKPQDVIMSVDGASVGNDGKFSMGQSLRLPVETLLNLKEVGDSITLQIFRNNKEESYTAQLNIDLEEQSLIRSLEGKKPSYFIYCGIAFQAVSEELIGAYIAAKLLPIDMLFEQKKSTIKPGAELVIVGQVFSDDLTEGYEQTKMDIIETVKLYKGRQLVKSVEIENLVGLANTLESTPEDEADYFLVETKSHSLLALDRKKAAEKGEEILANANVFSDRSENLKKKIGQTKN